MPKIIRVKNVLKILNEDQQEIIIGLKDGISYEEMEVILDKQLKNKEGNKKKKK